MSESVEEYLEAMYNLTSDSKSASTSEISRRLKIAPPSVTEMLRKLAAIGYVNYSAYQGATLTPEGFELAEKMARKHRLLERFLHDMLHISKDKVHNEACAMEHALSDETERALCQTLKSPAKCPDDEKVIPPCSLDFPSCQECRDWEDDPGKVGKRKTNVVPLSSLKEKQEGTVAFIRGDNKSLRRLSDIGLTPRTKIRVNRIVPLKGPVEIAVRGSKLALGEEVACNVFIEESAKDSLASYQKKS